MALRSDVLKKAQDENSCEVLRINQMKILVQ